MILANDFFCNECIYKLNGNHNMMTETYKSFNDKVESLLENVNLEKTTHTKIVLGDFNAFSAHFTNIEKSQSLKNGMIIEFQALLNKKWQTERFWFIDKGFYAGNNGDFNIVFQGSKHVIRIHAHTEYELAESKIAHKVDIYTRKNESCFELLFCCCC